ncbi:F0F1 ATP synthase subunit delta [Alkaliphilus peptidifermentans]|uniref:ATP synthase subunit delta n=1 Tax=Alkaliphilus peptidifermentans DSM 18978 TaxID=1120976 RepID=A0A1G5JHS5_9FIRM|nr:F0F1 ATP synthase subunit delta [Alkaliphilus peptidifermentans]SCY87440.1 ATP synthase F1 subcomplex delta subunit [Alkaliphilus peptidifermentans DSM 18978]
MAELVAKRYAYALYEVGLEDNRIQPLKEELQFVADCIKEYSQLADLLGSPLIQQKDKKEILSQCFKDRVSNEVLSFLYILIDKRRQNYIHQITEEYVMLANKSKNMVAATAVTAIPMKEEDLLKLQVKLSMSSGKNVNLINEIDSEVIGGILIKMGDKVIDGTIKNRLGQMKEQLSQIIV